jgi:multiple sugar transport system permease protein
MGTLLKSRKKPTLGLSKQPARYYLLGVVGLILGITTILPFVFMLSSSFKPSAYVFSEPLKLISDKIQTENYVQLWQHKFFLTWYMNSIKTVILTVLSRFIFVTMAAYAFARLRFRFKEVIFLFILSTMMITNDTTIISRYLLYKVIGLLDTHMVIYLPNAFDVFFLFFLRQFFRVIPMELSESAVMDGCSHFRIYYRIILPLAKPALITMALFTFIWVWNDYVSPLIFIASQDKQLLSVGLQSIAQKTQYGGKNYALQMAGASVAVIPLIVLFAFAQKYFIKGIAMSGIKG